MAVSQGAVVARAARSERARHLAEMYQAGATLEQCGQRYAITRERVRQILKKTGLSALDGGTHAKSEQRRLAYETAVAKRRELNCQRIFGASHEACIEANGNQRLRAKGTRGAAYLDQRRNAAKRGIEWQITFLEWCDAWNASGKFHERGLERTKYVMGRRGDNGPYAPWNIRIITLEANSREYQNVTRVIRGNRDQQRRQVRIVNKTGFRGVAKYGNRFYAYITVDGKSKCIGRFNAAEQAAIAYDKAAVERYGTFAITNFPAP